MLMIFGNVLLTYYLLTNLRICGPMYIFNLEKLRFVDVLATDKVNTIFKVVSNKGYIITNLLT